ncbi:esterase YqiA [Alteromonadaceae bacterium M269]|nr:esterase YqiA [Alteromonadaceae bacterium M269]
MSETQTTLIYLHGFLSSPQSVKAVQTKDFFAEHYPQVNFVVPQISNYPDLAIAQLRELVSQYQNTRLRFIGSSMGGFLSTHLVSQFGGKAVLINPAVEPHILLKDYLGEHTNPYTGEVFDLESHHMQILKELLVDPLPNPENFWALLQTEDETLDYRLAERKYQDSKLTIEQGGDHSFVGYERHLATIAEFLIE